MGEIFLNEAAGGGAGGGDEVLHLSLLEEVGVFASHPLGAACGFFGVEEAHVLEGLSEGGEALQA